MKYANFLQSITKQDFWNSSRVFCFKGKIFYPLFFNKLLNLLEKDNYFPCSKEFISSENLKDKYRVILEQSFLGNYHFYWLGDISVHLKNSKFLNFISNYKGPNLIAFFVLDGSKVKLHEKSQLIEISSNLNLDEFKELLTLYCPGITDKKITLVNSFFSQRKRIDLDSACMLMNYLELIKTDERESYEYLSNVFQIRPVLNQLSSAFWTKNVKEFFKLWIKICDDYSEVFWVIFWTEQVWKAYHTISFLNQKKFIKARQFCFGLPFYFINKDFKNFKLEELACLFEDLYEIDFAVKRGSTFYSLDLLYLNYFNKSKRVN